MNLDREQASNKFGIGLATLLILALLPSLVLAGGEWMPQDTIKRYYPLRGSTFYINMTSGMINPAGCDNSYYYVMRDSSSDFEEAKRVILTAKASGFKVGGYILDDECDGAYPILDRIFIQ